MGSNAEFRLGHLRLYKAELLEPMKDIEKLEQFREFFGNSQNAGEL